jgi:hypothetical protein
MQERRDWQALRTCDALVEYAMANGAYQEALDHLVRGYQRVMVSFCRAQLGSAGAGGRAEELSPLLHLPTGNGNPHPREPPREVQQKFRPIVEEDGIHDSGVRGHGL